MAKVSRQEVVDVFNDLYDMRFRAMKARDEELELLLKGALDAAEEVTWLMEEREEKIDE